MPIDLICIAVLGYGFWQGFNRGIINTVFNIAAYLFGVVFSFKMTPTTTNILERILSSDNPSLFVAAFLVNLIFVMVVLRMAAKSFEATFRALYIGFLNQVAGGLVMGLMAVMIYSVLLWFFVKASLVGEATLQESRLYEPYLKDLPSQAMQLAERLRPLATDVWDTSLNWMDRLDKYGAEKTEAQQKIYEAPDDGGGIEMDPDREPAYPPPDDTGNGIEE
jgi:uncharacterized membrane protein required for colicin V production